MNRLSARMIEHIVQDQKKVKEKNKTDNIRRCINNGNRKGIKGKDK